MKAAESVHELFAQLPAPGRDIVWLADELISIAQHHGPIVLPDPAVGTGVSGERDPGSPFWRLFRPLLARVAKLAADETGSAFDPYHGRYVLTRAGREGPVRLEISVHNMPGEERLEINRVVVPTHPVPPTGPRSSVHATPPQTAG